MGQRLSNPYLFQSRIVDGKHVAMVGAKCRKCDKTEWYGAPNPGWGRRVFGNKGWVLGNGPDRHTCPTCEQFRRSGIHHAAQAHELPEGRVVSFPSAELEPAILAQDIAPPAPTPEPEPVNTQLAEALAPVKAEMAAPAARKWENGVYTTADSAAVAAGSMRLRLGLERGRRNVDFRVEQKPDGTWDYVFLGAASGMARIAAMPMEERVRKASEAKRANWAKAGRKPGDLFTSKQSAALRARAVCKHLGVDEPLERRHYRLKAKGGHWRYELVPPLAYPGMEPAPVAVPEPKVDAKPGLYDLAQQAADHIAQLVAARKPSGKHFKSAEGLIYGRRDNCCRAARLTLAKRGIHDAVEGQHFRLIPAVGGQRFEILELPVVEAIPAKTATVVAEIINQEPPVSDASTQAVRDQERAAERATAAEAPKPATTFDNRRIRDALDDHYYDEANERYKGDWSDATVADQLKLPRAWVSRVREIYGPDRNDSERLKVEAQRLASKKALDELESMVTQANKLSDTVIETTAGLNDLMGKIALKRKEIGL